MRNYWLHIKLFDRNIRFFLLATAFHGFVFFGIYTLLLNLYLLRLGYGPEFIGLVNGIGPLMMALVSLPAGLLSRRWGSRRMMIMGYTVTAFSLGVLPLSGFLPDYTRDVWIVASYALSWVAGAFLVVNFSPYMMAWTGLKERNYAFAIQTAMFPVAGFLGSFLGGNLPSFFASLGGLTLESPIPYRNALLVAAAIDLCAAVAMWQTQESSEARLAQRSTNGGSSSAPLRLIALFAFVSFLMVMGEWTMRVYFNVYLDSVLDVPTSLIGLLAAGALFMGLLALFSPKAAELLGKKRLILCGYLGISLAFLPLIFIPHWLAVGLGYMAMIASLSLFNPTFGVFSQTLVEPQWRTMMSSSIAMSFGVAIALTSFGGGFIISSFGFQALFTVGAGVVLLAAIIAWRFFPSNYAVATDTASTPEI